MNEKHRNITNIILGILVGFLTITLAHTWPENPPDGWIKDALSDFGVSVIGAIFCGLLLYGFNNFHVAKDLKDDYFLKISPNSDMGQHFWIDFIKDVDVYPGTLWFAGNRHETWIATGLAYREPLFKKFVSRVNKYKVSKETAWEIKILVMQESSVQKWQQFITEVANSTNYHTEHPQLIKVTQIPPNMIPYSIVSYGSRTVITPYLSTGRTAKSATFDLVKGTEIEVLYQNDLYAISDKIAEDKWWYYGKQG